MNEKNKSNTIDITRIYDAPVKMVWDAWTDPQQAAHWWGPRGFTITNHSKDFRVGGNWHYTMHGPDGKDWENNTKYLEIEPMSRMVYDHGGNSTQPPLFRVTVTFTDLKGKTKMDMSMALETPEKAAETRQFIKAAGGNGTWDRLAEYLEKETTGQEKFVINRSFDTSIETMYQMWSDPKHLSQWLAPTGSEMTFIRADLRPGGSSFYSMTYPGGKMYGHVDYRELTKPTRLVYQQGFCDENEKPSRHPMVPTFPAAMITTVDFAAEGPNQTRVTVTWEVASGATPEEMATFIQMKAGMTQGWTGSFDKLEECLTN